MSSKTRKLIWSVPLMATLAVVGALAVFVVLGLPNANPAEAQTGGEFTDNPAWAANAELTPTVRNASIRLVWPALEDPGSPTLDGFAVQYSVGTTGTWMTSRVLGPTARSHIVTGLNNGTAYAFNVAGVLTDQSGTVTDTSTNVLTVAATMDTTPIASRAEAPTNVAATQTDDNEITVTWTAVPTSGNGGQMITGYTADYQIDCTGGWSNTGIDPATLDASATSVKFVDANSLTDTAEVCVRVAADNGITREEFNYDMTTGVAGSIRIAVINTDTAVVDFSSKTPGGASQVTIKITPGQAYPIGSSVTLFLSKDFGVPDTFSSGMVFVTQDRALSGSGARAYTTVTVESKDDSHAGDDSSAITILVPDMNPSETATNGAGFADADVIADIITFTILKAGGIKNPTEGGKMHAYSYMISSSAGEVEVDGPKKTLDLDAKVALSDENNKRDYELVIVGSGFNAGRKATAYVRKGVAGDAPPCDENFAGTSVGSGTVGTDHKVSITDTVTTDDYTAGKTNYVCVRDDNSPERRYAPEAEQFELQPSIAAEPAEVNSGDEVTVKLRDFEVYDAVSVTLAGTKVWMGDTDTDGAGPDTDTDAFEVEYTAGAKELTFDMPGGLSGVIEISVDVKGTAKETTITVVPSSLTLSKSEVAPNESIVITGSGFSERSRIDVTEFKIDGHQLVVDESGTEGVDEDEHVETTSAGTFSASVNIWTVEGVDGATDNPALDAGTYKIEVEDAKGFSGSVEITILAPTLTVNPTSAGPRDYIVISGENWPVSTSDDDREVEIEVDGRDRNADIDSTGRFNLEYRLKATIQIGMEHTIKVTYNEDDRNDIEKEITFIVPSSNVTITPSAVAPGETIDLEITGMPILRLVDDVIIDGADRLGNANFNTDANGDVTVTGVLVPYADPGFFPVRIKVGDETAVVQLEILAESSVRGAASPLPESVTDLGDSLVRIFHFNTASKVWTFYDPRPEFDGLNTLTELAAGQPYWILVSEDAENVVLNERTRNLTCVGGDCWNQLVW